jgi:hypothetical protein
MIGLFIFFGVSQGITKNPATVYLGMNKLMSMSEEPTVNIGS